MNHPLDPDGLVFLEFDLGRQIERQVNLFQAEPHQQDSQLLLQKWVKLARQAGVVGAELRKVQRVSIDLPVDGFDADLGDKARPIVLFVTGLTPELGTDLVRRKFIAAVSLDQARGELEFHLGFPGPFGLGRCNQLRLEQGKLDVMENELVE